VVTTPSELRSEKEKMDANNDVLIPGLDHSLCRGFLWHPTYLPIDPARTHRDPRNAAKRIATERAAGQVPGQQNIWDVLA